MQRVVFVTRQLCKIALASCIIAGHAPAYAQAPAQLTNLQPPESALANAQAATSQESHQRAVWDFIAGLERQYQTAHWKKPFTIGSYRITFVSDSKDLTLWDPAFFDGYVPAGWVQLGNVRSHVKTAGQGVPFVGIRQATDERRASNPFLPEVGMACAVTMLLDFEKSTKSGAAVDVTIKVVNPRRSSTTLAADYSAPLEMLMAQAGSNKFVREGLLKPIESVNITGLFMLEPYQKDKIPVVMVHGLDASPRTFLDTYNELMVDPALRNRYQFWFFRYATGNPVVLSAALLREDLQRARELYDPKHKDKGFENMIVIGHSMGGMLARLLVTDPGDAFWRANSNVPLENTNLTQKDQGILKKALFFRRQPYVKRVVFIATPHRGSNLASSLLGKLADNMVKPLEVTGVTARHPNGAAARLDSLAVPSSIDNLKPSNRFIQTLQTQPIYARYHSIIGNQGVTRHGVPDSDGVVPYESSHLEGAESEVVVPSSHSAHMHPQAVQELNRILRVHLASRQ